MSYFTYQEKNIYFTMKGKGPLLIILPGNTASSVAHENEINYFAGRYRAASIDFLGTGKSDRLTHWTADWWEAGSHQIAALIDHLGYENGGACIKGAPEAIECPVLMTFAEHDSFLPNVNNTTAELEAKIRKCEVKIFPNGDHPLYLR